MYIYIYIIIKIYICIYINLILIHTMIYHFISVLVNDKGEGVREKKWQGVTFKGEEFKKCHSALTNFLNDRKFLK